MRSWIGNGYCTIQESKEETLSILEKKKISCITNEWQSLQEIIEDINLEINSDEADEAIKDLLEKNCNHQEVRKLKIE